MRRIAGLSGNITRPSRMRGLRGHVLAAERVGAEGAAAVAALGALPKG